MKETKMIDGKKISGMNRWYEAPDCIPKNVVYEAAYGTFRSAADGMPQVRGPTLV